MCKEPQSALQAIEAKIAYSVAYLASVCLGTSSLKAKSLCRQRLPRVARETMKGFL
ncbi:hypothetical protein AVDCRST_MAG94-3065 [uncultured Leptolyngbya sp.]|uniref:Uncharacterized protein n=1 Tax=uncultured Leptolyngbya sp. TaxID=332963 RepID=A0A6J4MCY5_9CYAN|nr:hypothetical protein AVDCRST_MAG94-3065 [uncultured Leptolyngbya sp.]